MKRFRIMLTVLMLTLPGVWLPAMIRAEVAGVETLQGKIEVDLYEGGTGSEQSGVNDIHASVGDTITVDVFLHNNNREAVTGLDFYLTVPDAYFNIVSQGTNTDHTPMPFIWGSFFRNVPVQRPLPKANWLHGDSLTAMDNAIADWQLDYIELTTAPLEGDRPSSNLRYGVGATFQLIAKAPGDSIEISLDKDSPNVRYSRYKILGTGESFDFKRFVTCYITVTGMSINPPLPDIMMKPASVDTTLDLDEHVGVSSIPDSLFVWQASGQSRITVNINPTTHRVTFTSPSDFHGFEDITFTVGTASDPDMASDVLRVIVDDPPFLVDSAIPDTLYVHEDSLQTVLYLPSVVTDIDDIFGSLAWRFETGGNVSAVRAGASQDTLKLRGSENYFGNEFLKMVVTDPFGLADSTTVPVRVLPVNDAPRLSGLPDLEFERTKPQTLNLSQYATDVDGDPLTVSYQPPLHFIVSVSGMTVVIREQEGFLGTENIVLRVTDPGGLSDADTLSATVTPLKGIPEWTKLPKIGFPQGGSFSGLILWDYVSDPDGPDSELTFTFSGYDDVDDIVVDPLTGRLFLYDLNDRAGWDLMTVTATDFDGNSGSTTVLVFIGPKDGTPIVGALPDTTIRAGTVSQWIDLDDYYYDVDNTDDQMTWTWEHAGTAELVDMSISQFFHRVTIASIDPELMGLDDIRFIVTDPDSKTANDASRITVLGETKPVLDLPPKFGFIAGTKLTVDLDDYAADPDFPDSLLTWNWNGNVNIEMYLDPDDLTKTRPLTFSSSADWIGWERVHFAVENPLGGVAVDSTHVFSVPADGTPVAGGLEFVNLKAGTCDTLMIDLDDYVYDADTQERFLTWTATGQDSVIVTINAGTHRVQFCSPSETFEGDETVTFTVSDGIHEASMDVRVTVYGAVYRNVFSMLLFRNPMQSDYMDIYLSSTEPLNGVPSLTVGVEGGTTPVIMTALVDSLAYYQGKYLLPYAASIGLQHDATLIAEGLTSTGQTVQDTLSFAYGRFGVGGGKLALGPVTVTVPERALATPVLLTLTGDESPPAASKAAGDEVQFIGDVYTLAPAGFSAGGPLEVAFDVCCRPEGIGIYRIADGGWTFAGGDLVDQVVRAATASGGMFRLGYDRTLPGIRLDGPSDGGVAVAVTDGGSGIDPSGVRFLADGVPVRAVYDTSRGCFIVEVPPPGDRDLVELTVIAADRVGNTATEILDISADGFPLEFSVQQNIPNPFNPATSITFTVPERGRVVIAVYDILGRQVSVLADDVYPPGRHTVVWRGCDDRGVAVSSGVYLYRVVAGSSAVTRKMILVR